MRESIAFLKSLASPFFSSGMVLKISLTRGPAECRRRARCCVRSAIPDAVRKSSNSSFQIRQRYERVAGSPTVSKAAGLLERVLLLLNEYSYVCTLSSSPNVVTLYGNKHTEDSTTQQHCITRWRILQSTWRCTRTRDKSVTSGILHRREIQFFVVIGICIIFWRDKKGNQFLGQFTM